VIFVVIMFRMTRFVSEMSTMLISRGMKSKAAVKKRFFRTSSGGLKRSRCGRTHFASSKSSRQLTYLSQPTMVTRSQLKTLNKMLQD
jgi:ribosomal protein L35